MELAKRKRLEKAGWHFGTVQEFLGLTDEESALIEMKLSLAANLKNLRHKHGMTQLQAARRIGTSQARVAKMESSDASVSIDLYVRSLMKLGATRRDLGRAIARTARRAA
jgi:DNA-binding XRE family transcriptional regulator